MARVPPRMSGLVMLVVILVGPPRVQGLAMLVVSPLGATLAPTLMSPLIPVKTRLMPLQRLKRSRRP